MDTWQMALGMLQTTKAPLMPTIAPGRYATLAKKNVEKGIRTEELVLDFLDEPKTVRQVMAFTGMSKGGSQFCLRRLRDKGLVAPVPDTAPMLWQAIARNTA